MGFHSAPDGGSLRKAKGTVNKRDEERKRALKGHGQFTAVRSISKAKRDRPDST